MSIGLNQQWVAQQPAWAVTPPSSRPGTPPPDNSAVYGLQSDPNQRSVYNPTSVTYQQINPQELTSEQLNGLMDQNSPYIQHAIALSQQQAAAHGLLNGSMSAGAAENAAVGAALPIAQANAQEYAQIGAANQQAANQFAGENIAAGAQVDAANAMGSAQFSSAQLQAETQKEALAQSAKQFSASQAQQFQEYGMGLGQQYAQMGQQAHQFDQSMAFQYAGLGFQYAGLGQNFQEFQQSQRTQIGEFQGQMSLAQYQIGLGMQQTSQNQYANMFGAIMSNPNMTPEQRQSALATAQNFYGGMSQANASIPAWTPPWVSDPHYWTVH